MAVTYNAYTSTTRTDTSDPFVYAHSVESPPKAVVVAIINYTSDTDHISGVKYGTDAAGAGGVSLTRIARGVDTTTEPGSADLWFAGSGLTADATTYFAVDFSSATGDDMHIVCMTFNASTNCAVLDSGSLSGNVENPQDTMVQNGTSALSICAIHSGAAAPSDLTLLSGMSAVASVDTGNSSTRVDRQTTASTTNFTIGYTASSDDVGFACLAICEASASKTGSDVLAPVEAEQQVLSATVIAADTLVPASAERGEITVAIAVNDSAFGPSIAETHSGVGATAAADAMSVVSADANIVVGTLAMSEALSLSMAESHSPSAAVESIDLVSVALAEAHIQEEAAAIPYTSADAIAVVVADLGNLVVGLSTSGALAVAAEETWDLVANFPTDAARDDSPIAVTEHYTLSASATVADAMALAIIEAQSGEASLTVADALEAILAESGSASVEGESFILKLYEDAALIASWTVSLTTDLTLLTNALSAEQKAAISDRTKLRYTLIANGRQVEVAWMDLQTPVAADAATPKTSADVLLAALAELFAVTGTVTATDAPPVVMDEVITGTGTVTTADTIFADLRESLDGTATATTLDAIVAFLVEAQSYADVTGIVPQSSADVLGLFLSEVTSHTGSVTAADRLEAVLAEILAGSATITTGDVCAAILADALTVAATLDSRDAMAVVLAYAVSMSMDIASYTSADTLSVTLQEVSSGTAAVTQADALPGALDEAFAGTGTGAIGDTLQALLADTYALTADTTVADVLAAALMEAVAVGSTIAVSDDVLAVLTEAMRADGAITAADTLEARFAEWGGDIPITQTGSDALALIVSEAGVAAAVMPINPFLVGLLVATWPTRKLMSQMPVYTTANRTTGWPYTLVQKAA